MNVIKRDGTIQMWDFSKIESAVSKAFHAVGQEVPEKFNEYLANEFKPYVKRGEDLNVEQIHDIVRDLFIKKNQFGVVDSFIRWRKEREEIRESKSDLINDIHKALYATDIQNQNANVDEASFGGRIGEAARVVCKKEALRTMRKQSRKNHENNQNYIHDLDSWAAGMHNCLSIPFDNLLKNGFTTRQTDVRGANSVNTAFQLVAVIFQLQSLQQFGGVSATHLDWTMVPYVRKSFVKHINDVRDTANELTFGIFNIKPLKLDNDFIVNTEINNKIYTGKHWYSLFKRAVHKVALRRTRKEIHQAVEGLYHNLNTLQSRSGNQLPFTSINYGTCTNMSGRMVIDELLTVSIEGLGNYHTTSIFPCSIFQYMKGINDKPGTPNYDLFRKALKSTAKRIYPNYANANWSAQTNWVDKDRNDKQEYIDNLPEDEYNKLLQSLENNSELQNILGLEIDEED